MWSCEYLNSCGGCQPLAPDISSQQALKIDRLKQVFESHQISHPEIKVIDVGPGYLRDYVDLISADNIYGFYSKDHQSITDIKSCAQMSPELSGFFQQLLKLPRPGVKKGSLRLRVSPDKTFGVWLDFSNQDIAMLFKEENFLRALSEIAIVEIGQRKKRLFWDHQENRFRLKKDPEYFPWTQTWIGSEPFPLFSVIGGFSQPSLRSNRELLTVINQFLNEIKPKSAIEFGCGFGNYTLPLQKHSEQLIACDWDELSLGGLRKTVQEMSNHIEILQGDFRKHQVATQLQAAQADAILVNPSRSGLGEFTNLILNQSELKNLIYVSCHLQSFIFDMEQMKSKNLKLAQVYILDQFPQTPHFEILSLWKI